MYIEIIQGAGYEDAKPRLHLRKVSGAEAGGGGASKNLNFSQVPQGTLIWVVFMSHSGNTPLLNTPFFLKDF